MVTRHFLVSYSRCSLHAITFYIQVKPSFFSTSRWRETRERSFSSVFHCFNQLMRRQQVNPIPIRLIQPLYVFWVIKPQKYVQFLCQDPIICRLDYISISIIPVNCSVYSVLEWHHNCFVCFVVILSSSTVSLIFPLSAFLIDTAYNLSFSKYLHRELDKNVENWTRANVLEQ